MQDKQSEIRASNLHRERAVTRDDFAALVTEKPGVSVARVSVDGQEWRQLPSLSQAGGNDPVYSLDAETGQVTFGDGVQGRRLPHSSTVVASYRTGVGHNGIEVSVRYRVGSSPIDVQLHLDEKGVRFETATPGLMGCLRRLLRRR